MRTLKIIILPSEAETRLLGKTASGICLRATLPTTTEHTHALPRLLVGFASFMPVRAALVVPSRAPSCATKLYPDWFADVGGHGYDLQVIDGSRRERREWWGR